MRPALFGLLDFAPNLGARQAHRTLGTTKTQRETKAERLVITKYDNPGIGPMFNSQFAKFLSDKTVRTVGSPRLRIGN
jgi:hypothetical protein